MAILKDLGSVIGPTGPTGNISSYNYIRLLDGSKETTQGSKCNIDCYYTDVYAIFQLSCYINAVNTFSETFTTPSRLPFKPDSTYLLVAAYNPYKSTGVILCSIDTFNIIGGAISSTEGAIGITASSDYNKFSFTANYRYDKDSKNITGYLYAVSSIIPIKK